LGRAQETCPGPAYLTNLMGDKMRYTILWIIITILFGAATGEFGFIMGIKQGQSFNHEGRLLQHQTKIMILESEMKVVKEKLRLP
jgi:hypothetical protein